MKKRIFASPSTYVQGAGVLEECGTYIHPWGQHPFIIGGRTAYSVVEHRLTSSLDKEGCSLAGVMVDVKKCTQSVIGHGCEEVKTSCADLIIGVGGGSAVDAAKAVGYHLHLPVVTIPTVASTNADISAVSVIYDEEGKFSGRIRSHENPRLALVDTQVLISAPPRYLASGMGDALSCRFEVEACIESGSQNHVGGSQLDVVKALCTLCHETLISHGRQALVDAQNARVTDSAERVIEAIKFQSAIGFESGGNAAAHAIHNGFTRASPVRGSHGEIVTFSIIAQLFLEKKPLSFIQDITRWCRDLGLPITLTALSVPEEYIDAVSKETCRLGSSIFNEPFPVSHEDVAHAILAASEFGESLL